MKPADIFGLIVRCLGLVMCLWGGYLVYLALLALIPCVFSRHALSSLLLYGLPCLAVGVWFLRGAPWLVSMCYGREEGDE